MMIGRCVVKVVVFWCLFALAAYGAPIVLHNTGASLGPGAPDPWYQMASGPVGAGDLHVVLTGGAPFPPWVANLGTSAQWIAPQSDYQQGQFDLSGIYEFRLSFDLTGLIPSTAVLTGQWASDNCGEIYLNGQFTGQVSGPPGCLGMLHPFTITSGFQGGVNTLDFRVNNPDGPTGLLVADFVGTAAQIPEPATLTLLGSALAGFWLLRRRNRKA